MLAPAARSETGAGAGAGNVATAGRTSPAHLSLVNGDDSDAKATRSASNSRRPARRPPALHQEPPGDTVSVEITAVAPAAAGVSAPAPAPSSAAVATAATSAPAASRNRRPQFGFHVLVVDDESLNTRVLNRMLSKLGCTVVVRQDGDEVLDALAAEQFDIVFLDIYMPRMLGDEACRQLRAAGYTMPVVAATGNAQQEDKARYMAAGFSSVLPKPFGQSSVLATLRDAAAKVEVARRTGAPPGPP